MSILLVALAPAAAQGQTEGGADSSGGSGAVIRHQDSVIIDLGLCVSSASSCLSADPPAGFPLMVKQGFPAIAMESTFASFPDWFLWTDLLSGDFAVGETFGTPRLRVRAGAPRDVLTLAPGGVGVNNTVPVVPLHVKSANDNGAVFAESTAASDRLRTMFGIINNGPSSLTLVDESPGGEDWFFRGSQSGPFAIDALSTATTTEMFIAPGGTLTIAGSLIQGSSSAIKREVVPVDAAAVLAGVRSLEISTWSYDHETGVRHLGPMAEDFAAAFGLGANPAGIASVDSDGVALAAIQALADENAELRTHNAELEARLAAVEAQLSG